MTTSRWRDVADELRREIVQGEVGASGALDTEAELCRRFSTSRITVRRALAELKTEGLVRSQRGSGWRVDRLVGPAARLLITTQRPTNTAPTLARGEVSWRTQRPSSALIAALTRLVRPPSSELASVWTRMSYVVRASGAPFDLVDLWLAPTVGLGVSRGELANGETAYLLRKHGVRFGAAVQSARADLATPRDVKHLGCAEGDPILVVERAMIDEHGAVVFLSLHRHPGRRVSVEVDLPTTDSTTNRRLRVQVG